MRKCLQHYKACPNNVFQGCNSCNFEVPFANDIYMFVFLFFVWSACPMVWVSVYITVLFGYLLSVVLLRICDYYICMKCLCKIWKYKWMHCSKAAHRFSASLKNSNLYLSILRNSVEIKWRLLCVSIYVTGWVVQQHTLILTACSI